MKGKFLNDDNYLPEPYEYLVQKLYTYATCYFIEFCQIVLCDSSKNIYIAHIHAK